VIFNVFVSVVIGALVWIFQDALLGLYAPRDEARMIAKQLIFFIAIYQISDAMQVTAAFILLGYKVAFWPMVIYAGSLWGIGLLGGYLMAFNKIPHVPEILQGAKGFWAGNSISLGIAALFLLMLFKMTARKKLLQLNT
jgi:MATE family multidrug resistance protein